MPRALLFFRRDLPANDDKNTKPMFAPSGRAIRHNLFTPCSREQKAQKRTKTGFYDYK